MGAIEKRVINWGHEEAARDILQILNANVEGWRNKLIKLKGEGKAAVNTQSRARRLRRSTIKAWYQNANDQKRLANLPTEASVEDNQRTTQFMIRSYSFLSQIGEEIRGSSILYELTYWATGENGQSTLYSKQISMAELFSKKNGSYQYLVGGGKLALKDLQQFQKSNLLEIENNNDFTIFIEQWSNKYKNQFSLNTPGMKGRLIEAYRHYTNSKSISIEEAFKRSGTGTVFHQGPDYQTASGLDIQEKGQDATIITLETAINRLVVFEKRLNALRNLLSLPEIQQYLNSSSNQAESILTPKLEKQIYRTVNQFTKNFGKTFNINIF